MLAACGDGGSTAATTQESTAAQQKPASQRPPATNPNEPNAGGSRPPKVHVPSGPPPENLVIKDLRKGSGQVTKPYSRLAVNFVAVDYKSGRTLETRWSRPFIFEYNHGLPMQGWEEGLKGMRVGGRRHIVVPSRLAYKQGDLVYVVDLLSVEDRSKYAPPQPRG
ncbi:MAG TPA: FKBP-type peptidyl-prolyl cis-trans isomerase [Solirubrobacterales bacterium]|nr:FKBP-type peptidyl-prolyl cis-trans isomerase [Solirubrobacterales bacterium]